ncbi:MAG: M20/M25/M40 family metallo-hydrolase [Bacteroidetes bacterium]|nr:MAG: M20/M25/M40 family metallo-hydrolase [Bacteroidota bacterium]
MVFWILLFAIIISSPVHSQPNILPNHQDEALVLLHRDDIHTIEAIAPQQIRVYQRFPDFYLVGLSKQTLTTIEQSGISVQRFDSHPWSKPYAIVSRLSSRLHERVYRGFNVQLLYKSDEFDIVKGGKVSLEKLREENYSVVEIEPVPISLAPASDVPLRRDHPHPGDQISAIIANVSDTTIRAYVQGLQNFGTRYYGNANRDSVFRWVRNRLLETGITDVVSDSFQYNSTWQKNIIATIPGTVNPSLEIIVDGHFDSYSSNLSQAPGADDNATGTAAALEMARVLKAINYQPSMTLRFIGFAAEEAGLRGSVNYAQKAKQQNRNIRAVLNYDMLGYRLTSQEDYDFHIVWYTGAEALSQLHATMATSYTLLNPVLTTQWRSSSDSWSFYQQGYKALFCIEYDDNPYYHTPNDLLSTLDISYAKEIVKAGLATLLTIDQLPPPVPSLTVNDNGNGTSLFAQWQEISIPDFQYYVIYVGCNAGVYDTSYTQTQLSRTISGLTNGTRYYIGVTPVDIAGQEGAIVEQYGTPRLVPLAPTGIVATNLTNSVHLTWNKNTEIDFRGYNVYRSSLTNPVFAKQNAQPIVDTLWYDDSLLYDVYHYYVTAQDQSGNESAGSDTLMGYPLDLQNTTMIRVNNSNDSKDTVWFGIRAGATDGIDTLMGEFELSPPEINMLDARWRISGTNGIAIDFRDTNTTPGRMQTYMLELQAGLNGYPITLTWSSATLSIGKFTLQDEQTGGNIVSLDMKAESLVIISDTTIHALEIVHSNPTFGMVHVSGRWNIVSIPLEVFDRRKSAIFPTATSDAYAFGAGYSKKDSLQVGEGYWVKFSSTQDIVIEGTVCEHETITVKEGWNLIGSISCTIPVSQIASVPGGVVTSEFYGYNNGYERTDSIESGKGYWVKVAQDASIILSSGFSRIKKATILK